jgi:hypothetical protein
MTAATGITVPPRFAPEPARRTPKRVWYAIIPASPLQPGEAAQTFDFLAERIPP